MESIFPDVLFLGPYFAPLFLRVAAFVAYGSIAYALYKNRSSLSTERFPIVGTLNTSLVMIGAFATALIALLFAVGLWVQVIAILGFIGALKGIVFSKAHPNMFPGGRTTYIMLALICIALFITGAGVFAIDLPY